MSEAKQIKETIARMNEIKRELVEADSSLLEYAEIIKVSLERSIQAIKEHLNSGNREEAMHEINSLAASIELSMVFLNELLANC